MPLETLSSVQDAFNWFVSILAQIVDYLQTDTSALGVPIGYVIFYFAMMNMVIYNFVNKGERDNG